MVLCLDVLILQRYNYVRVFRVVPAFPNGAPLLVTDEENRGTCPDNAKPAFHADSFRPLEGGGVVSVSV